MSQIVPIEEEPLREAPRVLFFGMQGSFSPPVLAALLQSGMNLGAVILPANPLPGVQSPPIQRRVQVRPLRTILPLVREGVGVAADLLQIALARRLPVWDVSRLSHQETLKTLAAYQPDFICVACFSRLIPRSIRALPTRSCLNVHPSLLPANRGPLPLFWDLREGRTTTGVTIHEVEAQMDSGAILAQEALAIPDGISYDQLEVRCAELGGKLLARAIWLAWEGRATRQLQDEARSSYHSFPTVDDFVVDPGAWSARHLYNFIRGVRNWEFPLVLRLPDEQLQIRDATDFSQDETPIPVEEGMAGKVERVIRCQRGWVRVLL